jgi:uncharacterized membrane protein
MRLQPLTRLFQAVPRPYVTAVVVLTAIGLALRMYGIDTRGAWWDEVSVWHDALSGHRSPQEAPLNTWVVHATMWLLQRDDTFALHLPAVLFGAFTIPAAFVLGRFLVDELTGVLTAALVCFSPVLISFSQEARPYGLLIFLTVIEMTAALALLAKWTRRRVLILTIVAAAAMGTHFVAFAYTLGLGLTLLIDVLQRWRSDGAAAKRQIIELGISGAVAIGVGLMWMVSRQAFTSVMTGSYRHGPVSYLRFILTQATLSFHSDARPWGWLDVVVGLFLALAIVGAVALARKRLARMLCVVLPMIGLLAGLYLQLGEKGDWPWYRYATPVTVPFLALVAAGLTAWRMPNAAVLGGVALLGTLFLPNTALRAWQSSAPNTRGVEYVRVANEIATTPKLTGLIFVTQLSAFADESDRLTSSYMMARRDGLPAYFVARDKRIFEIELRRPIGEIPVPVRTDKVVESLPPGSYAVLYGWDVHRGCSFLSPLLQDPVSGQTAAYFKICQVPPKK